ncbi:Na+/H+ antiporter subunit E [Jannaschia sp. CCS1]|uniref:Na+/H+ antiporter subunit E n=1 Tax=Jannaschia sp. (strain CCS1) TaxID=290400 RepID=UPI000053A0A5|nr:Na+/H+ antiporter subunit E [Jannaschia sp. CCS1]ABD56608.1 multisubunit sodium/proton antiporter, MrpE subunit [Jannaschia sp. CCS1]
MNIFALNVALAIAWAALTGDITLPNILIGFALGSAALFVTRPLYPGCERYFTRATSWVKLILAFLWELVEGSIQVVGDVLTPQHRSRPGIIAVPLDTHREMSLLVLTNYISLTPGTLSLDVTEDCRTLYIHAMFADDPDAIRASIKNGVEMRVKEAME